MNNENKTPVLEVSNLKKYFKIPGGGLKNFNFHAVDGVSFNIYKKEVFGLVGESGCGKTTTGRTIIRLYKPTSGYVKLNGQIIVAGYYDLIKELRRKTKEYRFLMLSQNPKKLRKFEINKEYDQKLKELKQNRKAYLKQIEEDSKEILTSKDEYDKLIYEIKSRLNNKIDTLTFNYNQEQLRLKKLLINAPKEELKLSKKQLRLNYKNKINGINDSHALTKAKRLELLKTAKDKYEFKLLQLENEFAAKILDEEIKNINPKLIKEELSTLKKNYLSNKQNLKRELASELSEHKQPDFKEILNKVVAKKKEKLFSIFKYLKDYFKIQSERRKTHKTNKEANTTNPKYFEYKKEFLEIRKDITEQIKNIKNQQRSKEAELASRKMQMIFQDPISSLNPRMTVQEIISEGLVINGHKNKAENKQKVLEVLKLVGLAPEYITRYPHEFSGGQRQRIGIARALVMNPSVIIADEPISALDVSIQAQVINLLKDLKEQLDLTILFIAHDLSVVKFFSDRIGVMYMGKMLEMASSEELFKHPLHPYTK